MYAISLRNVRSLVDTGRIDIRPITILLGKNSSGKSTLTRFFPLLRQSIEVSSNTPLLWFGDLVDFGSIAEVKPKQAPQGDVEFDFWWRSIARGRRVSWTPGDMTPRQLARSDVMLGSEELGFGLSLNELNETTTVTSVRASVGKDSVLFRVNGGEIKDVLVNEKSYLSLFKGARLFIDERSMIPTIYLSEADEETGGTQILRSINSPVDLAIRRIFRNSLHGRFSDSTIRNLVRRNNYAPAKSFLDQMLRSGEDYQSWTDFVSSLRNSSGQELGTLLRELYFLRDLPRILGRMEGDVLPIFRATGYIGPSRATGQRYYRIQELALDRIDPSGRNLAMFLYSLSDEQKEDFSKWSEKYLGYQISSKQSAGHVSLVLKERGSDEYFNLADVGYGLSQVLPFLVQIWASSRVHVLGHPQILAVEQPELHLHPAFQARLADALVGAVKSSKGGRSANLYAIIETHSQQLVNRLGELIHSGSVRSDDVVVYVFEKEMGESSTDIRRVTFGKEGELRNWPFGFFSTEQI